jgi:hypothetical protein
VTPGAEPRIRESIATQAVDERGDARSVLEMLATMMTAKDRGIVD